MGANTHTLFGLVILTHGLYVIANLRPRTSSKPRRPPQQLIPYLTATLVGLIPFAPWVFAAPAIAFAFLPGAIGDHPHGDTVAFASAVAGATAAVGVLVQPVGRSLNAKADGRGPAVSFGDDT